jgi:hypothetical protein
MGRGLACKGRCEHEVRRLLDLRDFNFSQPHHHEATVKQAIGGRIVAVVINLALSGVFFGTWYFYGRGIFLAVGFMNLAIAIFIAVFARRSRVRTDQFRLCAKCGYNVTGNTSGTCPECGYKV